jgi:hypothetical protein
MPDVLQMRVADKYRQHCSLEMRPYQYQQDSRRESSPKLVVSPVMHRADAQEWMPALLVSPLTMSEGVRLSQSYIRQAETSFFLLRETLRPQTQSGFLP